MANYYEAGFCGDFCGKCPNYPDECGGCIPTEHMGCHFVGCCLAKGIGHCGLCEAFPCEKLRDFVPDDRPGCPPGYHVEELRKRTEMGTDAWLSQQRVKWGRQ